MAITQNNRQKKVMVSSQSAAGDVAFFFQTTPAGTENQGADGIFGRKLFDIGLNR
jgi:hypothetical protein